MPNHQILVLYSKDESMKKEVMETLIKWHLEPIPVQNDPQVSTQIVEAKTVKPLTEKLMQTPNVSFVIVVLLGDDFVYPKESKLQYAVLRANQQLVFELGFWIGKLGRNRVFILCQNQKSFRAPTHYVDAYYVTHDQQGLWKRTLNERLTQAEILKII